MRREVGVGRGDNHMQYQTETRSKRRSSEDKMLEAVRDMSARYRQDKIRRGLVPPPAHLSSSEALASGPNLVPSGCHLSVQTTHAGPKWKYTDVTCAHNNSSSSSSTNIRYGRTCTFGTLS